MCGRVIPKSAIGLAIVTATDTDDPKIKQAKARLTVRRGKSC